VDPELKDQIIGLFFWDHGLGLVFLVRMRGLGRGYFVVGESAVFGCGWGVKEGLRLDEGCVVVV